MRIGGASRAERLKEASASPGHIASAWPLRNSDSILPTGGASRVDRCEFDHKKRKQPQLSDLDEVYVCVYIYIYIYIYIYTCVCVKFDQKKRK